MAKTKKPKKCNYQLAPKDHPAYGIIRELVKTDFHNHLADAKIAVALRYGLKKDKDGILVLGKMKKASDLDRELKPFDFALILNATAWEELDAKQREALVFHELCHGQIQEDEETGLPKRDEKGRKVYRIRKHDLEEFRDVVAEFGLYKSDLADFVRVAVEQKKTPLFPKDADKPKMNVVG
jgi:hypothetical protein